MIKVLIILCCLYVSYAKEVCLLKTEKICDEYCCQSMLMIKNHEFCCGNCFQSVHNRRDCQIILFEKNWTIFVDMDNNSNIPKIVCDETANQPPKARKQKGWGHWNTFIKSKEYTDLVPGSMEITEDELAKHNKHGDFWIALTHEGRVCVYNVTLFAEYHPGGYDIIESVAGKDATEEFRVAHAYVSPNMISKFQVGFLIRTRFSSPNSLNPGRSMLPPLRKPSPKTKPQWDWVESGPTITVNFTLHKVLAQGLDTICVQCNDSNVFKIRLFLETEYYYFEIQLNSTLKALLDTLQYDEQKNVVSISMTNSSTFQLSHLGGVIEDAIIPAINAIDKQEYFPCTLIHTRDLNTDCREFTLQWPSWVRSGVPLGHHVFVKCEIGGDQIERPYTPVCEMTPCSVQTKGTNQITLMIKRYSDGAVSSHMHTLDAESTVFVSLPIGTFRTPSWLSVPKETKSSLSSTSDIKSLVFLAAGSGITPMIRLMLSCLSFPHFHCHLAFFNRKQCDIIYVEEFEEMERFYEGRVRVTDILSQPDFDWTGQTGRISESLCEELFTKNTVGKLFLICGPLGFNRSATEILRSWLVPDEFIWEFKG